MKMRISDIIEPAAPTRNLFESLSLKINKRPSDIDVLKSILEKDEIIYKGTDPIKDNKYLGLLKSLKSAS